MLEMIINNNNMTWLQAYNFEAVVPTTKKNLFFQIVIEFVSLLKLNCRKYQTNVIVREGNYDGKFLFIVREFVVFRTYHQSMFCMSIRFSKDNIDGFRMP